MYLHLGQDTLVNTGEIIGFFDLDNTTLSPRARDYLAAAEKAGQVVNVSSELPKSFVVCSGSRAREKQAVYISQLSAGTLKRRYDAGNKPNKISNKYP